MRKIIINADDLGRSKNINDCILYCFENDLITDSSLMVNMPGSKNAFNTFKKNKFPIGIHLVLSSDNSLPNSKPVISSEELCDSNGYFYTQNTEKFWDIINSLDQNVVYKEIKAQLQLFIKNMGQKPTHITSHHHVHGSPKLLPVFIKLSTDYEIPLRAPIQKSRQVVLSKEQSNRVITDHFATNYKGNINRANAENFINTIEKYDDGVIEIMVHPGYPAGGSDSIFNNWWQKELSVLEDKKVRGFLKAQDLINYRDLSKAKSNT